MGHLRLTVRSQGSEQRAGQLQSPHPLPDLTWCISGSQHQCQPLTGNQWSHPGQNPEPAQRRVVTGKAQSPRAGCLLLKQPPARLQAWSPLPEARPDHSCGLPGGLCRKAGALGLKHHMHFSLLEILTQAKLPALPWPGWRSLKKKSNSFLQDFATLSDVGHQPLRALLSIAAPPSWGGWCQSWEQCVREVNFLSEGPVWARAVMKKWVSTWLFFLSTLISRALFWAQSQGSLASAGLHGPAGLSSSWSEHARWSRAAGVGAPRCEPTQGQDEGRPSSPVEKEVGEGLIFYCSHNKWPHVYRLKPERMY